MKKIRGREMPGETPLARGLKTLMDPETDKIEVMPDLHLPQNIQAAISEISTLERGGSPSVESVCENFFSMSGLADVQNHAMELLGLHTNLVHSLTVYGSVVSSVEELRRTSEMIRLHLEEIDARTEELARAKDEEMKARAS